MLNEDVVKNINKLNNEQDNINLELSKKASKEDLDKLIQGGTNVAISKDISTDDWTIEEGVYTTIVEHNLVTRKVIISLIDKTTNNNVFCSYQILNDNSIKIFNESNNELECIAINGNSAINMVSATINDNRSTETTTYSSVKIEALLKVLESKIDDIENFKEVDNIRCTTDTGEYIIENSKKGYLTNFNIEGGTLVNLASTDMFTLEGNSTKEGDFIKLNNSAVYVNLLNRLNTGIYTLIVNVTDINVSYTIHTILSEGGNKEVFTKNGNQVLKLNLDNNIDKLRVYTTDSSNTLDIQMVLLEGDYTNTNISYFEGLQSVGQGDKIELLSCQCSGINIFNKNAKFKDNYILQYLNGEELVSENSNHKYTLDYIEIEPNTEYTFYSCSRNICWYDINKSFIQSQLNERIIGDKDIFYVARSPKNAKYLRVTIIKDLHDNGNKTIITKGNEYDKKIIPYTLRSLSNGIKDEVVYKNQGYKLIQRCEEINLNGQENWTQHGNSNDKTLIFYAKITEGSYNNSDNIELKCNRFKGIRIITNTFTEEGVYENRDGNIYIRILRSRLATQDLTGFKTWLNNNNVTFIRQLKENKEIKLVDLGLKTFEGETRFVTQIGNIIPTINFEVTQNFGSNIEILKNKINTLESMCTYSKTIDLSGKLINGWTLFSDVHRNLVITKNGNIVTIIGSIKGGTTSNGTVICKIPDGMIPKANQLFQVFNTIGTSVGLLYINSYGDFKVNSLTSNTAVIINAQYILD
ncbi:phage tail fiber protein [Clostridioides difficile]